MKFKVISYVILIILIGFKCVAQDSSFFSASEMLQAADYKNIPENAFFYWTLEIFEGDEKYKENRFICYKKGEDNFVFFTYYPNTSYGRCHLRIQNGIWMYFPLSDSVMRTSYQSAFLNSGLSYADVMYTELNRVYDAQYISQNSNIDIMGETYQCSILELDLKDKASGYAKIIAYIDEKTLLTIKREYYSKNNDLLKTIVFRNYVFENDQVVSFSLDIHDVFTPNEKTTALFWNIKDLNMVNGKYFSLNFLKSWNPEIKEE